MKQFLFFFFLSLPPGLFAQTPALTFEDLTEKPDSLAIPRYYFEGQPYTGKTSNRHEREKKIFEFQLVDGYLQRQLGWDFDGNKVRDFPYKNGLPHGLLIDYYPNGQEYFRAQYVNGKAHGMEYGWYADGSMRVEVKHFNGFPMYKKDFPKPKK